MTQRTIILIFVAFTAGSVHGIREELAQHTAPIGATITIPAAPHAQRLIDTDCEDIHRFDDGSWLFHCTDGTIVRYDPVLDVYSAIGNWKEADIEPFTTHTSDTYHPRPIPSTWELLCPCSYYQGDPL